MKIIVCIKQVPDTNEVKIDPKTNTLIREGVPSIINPDDKAAIEEALKIKDKQGAEVTVLTMGPPQAEYALREGLAMGADKGILLSSRSFAGSDTWATSLALSGGIKKIGNYDLIFCGRQAIDGDTAQVGPEIAEHLDLPQITYVSKIRSINKEKAVVERALEDGYEVIEVTLPAVFTIIKESNNPRYPNIGRIIDVFDNMSIDVWDEIMIKLESEKLGLKGSPTQVLRTFTPPIKAPGKMIEGNTDKEKVLNLLNNLYNNIVK
ncbi:electron transfer flavoprotein subunit beta [Alkalibaculum sp. M08DMB]|uniref:Electron transfer flavoprotein small subunit n=1 Tax=Alkalibaculum sporogenes TaxID=2655001 RepID=A0A6A7KAU6_9FIRM|nr:electron transfer flavoprotein subunit beta/FixA family protein [Alkalibaculum sporogenes]MPW26526.1 electron transfer flavoprotein subunit beta [Alkalibaculum sporogenes]